MIQRMSIVAAVLFVVGCGGDTSQQTQTAESSRIPSGLHREGEKPKYIPPPNALLDMTFAQVDTLRVMKKRYGIYRDEYWRGTGGVLGNDFFEVWYPEGRMSVSHAMRIFVEIMPARQKFESFFGGTPGERLIITIPQDMEHYTELTGRPWWYYGDIREDSLTFQPVYDQVKRGLAEIIIPHEYHQWALARLTLFAAPRWLEEGVASYLCEGEPSLLATQIREFPADSLWMSPDQVDAVLIKEERKRESRIAYYHSHLMVSKIVAVYGEDKLQALVRAMADGYDINDACNRVLNLSYEALLQEITPRQSGI